MNINKRTAKKQVKSFIFIWLNIVLQLIFIIKKKPKASKKNYFSICCIFKNEARYFKEWIEYHKIIGVDHIYAYNNFSDDEYLKILDPYINEGYLTLIDWPYEKSQIKAYQHCYDNYKHETFWMMFLDLDEFICPHEKKDIKEWIKPFEKYPSVELYWLMFGTSGIVEYNPNKLVIEQYTCSWKRIRNVGKIVLNTNYIPVKMYHHHISCWLHICGLKIKIPSINESKDFIFDYSNHKIPKLNTIQINHYWSKCLFEYVRKIDKGDMFDKKHDLIRKKMDFFYWHEYQNVSENKIIYRFLAELKMRLYGINIKFKQ